MINPQNFSRRILIIRAGAVGDVLMATPLISAIRNVFPNSYLGFLPSRYAMPLLQYNKEIDALYDIKYRKLPYWISMEKQKLVRKMREERRDVIFLLESNPLFAALIKKFNAEAVYGFNPPPPPFMKGGKGEFNGIQFLPDSHVISNFLKLGSLLGKELKEFEINEAIGEGLNVPILNLAGQTTVPELGALLKEMGMVISIDSSPAHI